MCVSGNETFNAISKIVGISFDSAMNYNALKANNEYRKQVALNNAKLSYNEGLRQQQLGINKSRLQKISGLQEASKQIALNSASGLDANSQTNRLVYSDILNTSQINSDYIKNEYNTNAKSYFNQANSYLNQYNLENKNYKQSLYNLGMSSLSNYSKVAKEWYENEPTIGKGD